MFDTKIHKIPTKQISKARKRIFTLPSTYGEERKKRRFACEKEGENGAYLRGLKELICIRRNRLQNPIKKRWYIEVCMSSACVKAEDIKHVPFALAVLHPEKSKATKENLKQLVIFQSIKTVNSKLQCKWRYIHRKIKHPPLTPKKA